MKKNVMLGEAMGYAVARRNADDWLKEKHVDKRGTLQEQITVGSLSFFKQTQKVALHYCRSM